MTGLNVLTGLKELRRLIRFAPVMAVLGSLTACQPVPGTGGERKPAPDLVLPKVDGNGSYSLAEQKGKVVLVDLWATWCGPCLVELPHLQKLAADYSPEDFQMVGIVLESGDPDEIRDFIREKALTYVNLLGEEDAKESFGPFLGYPTKYLIDRDGYVVKRYFGAAGDDLYQDVQRLIRTGSLGESETTS
jgi:thiol-disulfide isomerase/thioredoxin